jgi:predicted DNA-binding transcriptional regulator YafY
MTTKKKPGRRPGTGSQATRVLRLYRRLWDLSPAGAFLDELADEFGVSTRTMRRDLAVIRAAGVPLTEVPARTGRGVDARPIHAAVGVGP